MFISHATLYMHPAATLYVVTRTTYQSLVYYYMYVLDLTVIHNMCIHTITCIDITE